MTANAVPRPHVVVHTAIALDGATDGFEVDLGRYYALAQTWSEDCTLVGADTVLAQEAALEAGSGPGPAADGPLLAVVDSRARVRAWAALREAGHWSAVLALQSSQTRARPGRHPEVLVAGAQRVDLAVALQRLHAERGVRQVRVDSGGGLVGALLGRGLVDELSLLIRPLVAGSAGTRHWYGANRVTAAFIPQSAEVLDDGVVWLRAVAGVGRREGGRLAARS